jgi:hypothetical protein
VTVDSAKKNGPYTLLLEENFQFWGIPHVVNCIMWFFGSPYAFIASICLAMKTKRSCVAENQLFSESDILFLQVLLHFCTKLQTAGVVVMG